MFLPVTLDEAAVWLERNEVSGITGRDLLRLGAYGYLEICLPLSCRAYSPFKFGADALRQQKGRDVQKAHDDAYVDLLGLYALPPKTLFELEAKGKAKTKLVYGPGGEPIPVFVDVTVDELRVTSQELERFITHIERDTQTDAPAAAKLEAVKGITTQQVIAAFEDLHFDACQWSRALNDKRPWLVSCRVMKGLRGSHKTPALWNPVDIAVALAEPERGILVKKLDVLFVAHDFLKPWVDEWREKSEYLR